MISIFLSSCNIGIKTKTVIVFSSPYKTELMKGVSVIASNKKIRVALKTEKGVYVTKMRLGGFYVLSPAQLKAIKERLLKKDP